MGSWRTMQEVLSNQHEERIKSIEEAEVTLRRKVDVCPNWCCAFVDFKDPPLDPLDLRDIRQLSALRKCPICKSDRFFEGTNNPREVYARLARAKTYAHGYMLTSTHTRALCTCMRAVFLAHSSASPPPAHVRPGGCRAHDEAGLKHHRSRRRRA